MPQQPEFSMPERPAMPERPEFTGQAPEAPQIEERRAAFEAQAAERQAAMQARMDELKKSLEARRAAVPTQI
jgi:hypothetical protein